MAEELRDGASPYEEHVFSLLRVVRAAVSPPPSAEAATYDVALDHAAKVKTALSANPAAWAACNGGSHYVSNDDLPTING